MGPPYVVGIAGPSGAGKSTLARGLDSSLEGRAAILCEDWYCRDHSHVPARDREHLNLDCPEAVEHERLALDLEALRRGMSVRAPVYEHAMLRRSREVCVVEPAAIVIVEGLLLFVTPELRKLFDLRIFVEAPLDLCLDRRLRRDLVERGIEIDRTLAIYERFVRPMATAHVLPTRAFADLVIDGADSERWDAAVGEAVATIRAAASALAAGGGR